MSHLGDLARDIERAVDDFERAISGADAWRDDQRAELQRGRIEPLLGAARGYLAAVSEVAAAFDAAEQRLR